MFPFPTRTFIFWKKPSLFVSTLCLLYSYYVLSNKYVHSSLVFFCMFRVKSYSAETDNAGIGERLLLMSSAKVLTRRNAVLHGTRRPQNARLVLGSRCNNEAQWSNLSGEINSSGAAGRLLDHPRRRLHGRPATAMAGLTALLGLGDVDKT